jgi:hypothetical protein
MAVIEGDMMRLIAQYDVKLLVIVNIIYLIKAKSPFFAVV